MSDVSARLASALADRYRIEREMGQGGIATVYLAQDLKHDRQVAIKVLKQELAARLGAGGAGPRALSWSRHGSRPNDRAGGAVDEPGGG